MIDDETGIFTVPINGLVKDRKIERGPGLEIVGRLFVSLDELLQYATLPPVKFEKKVDLPVQGGGTVEARMYSVDGMLIENMGCILIMGGHSAGKSEDMAGRMLAETVEEYRAYREMNDPQITAGQIQRVH